MHLNFVTNVFRHRSLKEKLLFENLICRIVKTTYNELVQRLQEILKSHIIHRRQVSSCLQAGPSFSITKKQDVRTQIVAIFRLQNRAKFNPISP